MKFPCSQIFHAKIKKSLSKNKFCLLINTLKLDLIIYAIIGLFALMLFEKEKGTKEFFRQRS